MKGILALVLSAALLRVATADILSDLDAKQEEDLAKGQTVTITREIPGATWPEVRIYRKVDAQPHEVTKLFCDYESASAFIPNLVSAKIVDSCSANSKDVQYTVKMPVLSKITYIVRNEYRQDGDAFVVDWKLLQSPLAKSSKGSLRVEPHEGGSFIRYSNHVEPVTRLVAGLKGKAFEEAKTTVLAIAGEAERRSRSARKKADLQTEQASGVAQASPTPG